VRVLFWDLKQYSAFEFSAVMSYSYVTWSCFGWVGFKCCLAVPQFILVLTTSSRQKETVCLIVVFAEVVLIKLVSPDCLLGCLLMCVFVA